MHLASSAGCDMPTTTGRDPAMRLAERANVLSKRARDERTGYPIGDRGWPPDRGSPGGARTARRGSRRAVPHGRRRSAVRGPRDARLRRALRPNGWTPGGHAALEKHPVSQTGAPRLDATTAAHAWRPAALLTLDAATVVGSINSSLGRSVCIPSFFDSRCQLGGIDN